MVFPKILFPLFFGSFFAKEKEKKQKKEKSFFSLVLSFFDKKERIEAIDFDFALFPVNKVWFGVVIFYFLSLLFPKRRERK